MLSNDKQHPVKVRQQTKRYYTLNKNKQQDVLRNWRENNPEKVRAQKRRHYERDVWPQIPGTRQRKQKNDRYDPDEILRGLFEVRVELTDFRRPSTSPQPPPPLSLQPSRKQSSCSSSDSDMDEELLREMEAVLAEPEGPVKRRIRQIKKNRKEMEAVLAPRRHDNRNSGRT